MHTCIPNTSSRISLLFHKFLAVWLSAPKGAFTPKKENAFKKCSLFWGFVHRNKSLNVNLLVWLQIEFLVQVVHVFLHPLNDFQLEFLKIQLWLANLFSKISIYKHKGWVKKTSQNLHHSFCFISLATNMLKGWDIIHLKGEIHSSVWCTKTFL